MKNIQRFLYLLFAWLVVQQGLAQQGQTNIACKNLSSEVFYTGEVFFSNGSSSNAFNATARMNTTIGQPVIGESFNQEYNSGFGFWANLLLAPSAPTVICSEGTLTDRINVTWQPDPLSPAASGGFNIYRDGILLTTEDFDVRSFVDFNVIAGQFYTYSVAGKNQFGEGYRGAALGFLNPNGVVTGQVKTFSGNTVPGALVTLTPTIGTALAFDGDASVFAEYVPALSPDQFSVSCWVKLGDGNNGGGILDLGSSIAKNWWLHTTGSGTKGLAFSIGNGAGNVTTISHVLPAATKDDWHYVAATYNGASLLFYVDGELIETAAGAMQTDSMPLFVGERGNGNGFLIGKVDEVRIFDRQLAQTELQMFMSRSVSANTEGLQSYWKFDEGVGSKGFNQSKNKINAYLCGAAWTTDKPNVVNAGLTDETGFYEIAGVNYGGGTTFSATAAKNFYYNQSLEFNGANETYADLTDFDLPDSSTITLTVKAFNFSGNQVLLSKSDGSNNVFELNLNNGNLDLMVDGGSQTFGALGTGFHHLALTMLQNGGALQTTLYNNGTLVGSHTFSGVSTDWSGLPWKLGAKVDGSGHTGYFTGLIDEVAFFDSLLTLPEIQTFANIGTDPRHISLVNYFNLNEGTGTALHDMGTMLSGNGAVQGASWSTIAAITQILPHDFIPSARLLTLNPSSTSVDQVDFTDQSTIQVSGYVRFDGTTCFQKRVEILVNGASFSPAIYTDSDGKFIADFEPGANPVLTPKFEDHTFYPASWILNNLSSPVAGILFRNKTKRKVYGQMAGGLCRKSVIPAGAIVQVKVATLNGCYEQVKTLTGNGNFVFNGVPPDSVTIAVIEHSVPVIKTFFQNLGGPTLDLRYQNDTTDFIYIAPVVVEMTPLDTNQCGDAMLYQTGSYKTTIKVFEQYEGGRCYLDTAMLSIDNVIADLTQFDTLMTGGKFIYRFKAGNPNIVDPYEKTLQVTAEAHDEQDADVQSAVVLGKRARVTTFATTAPEIPTLILRDPPGDASSAYLEAGTTTCQNYAFSIGIGMDLSVEVTESLVPDLTTSVGVGAETEVEIDNTEDLGFGVSLAFSALTTNEAETCVTTTQRISTGDNDLVVGSKMGGDVYMGGAINYIFGITDELKFDTTTCGFFLDKGLTIFPKGFATTFIYSEYQIKNVVIPNLIAINDLASAARWQTIIDNNDAQKMNAVFEKNLSFDAGIIYEQSTTTEASTATTTEVVLEIGQSFSNEFGVTANGAGIVNAVSMSVTRSLSVSTGSSSLKSRTVGYTLADDDIGDYFSVNVKKDGVYGTPVFDLVSGRTQCPHEPNSQPREGVALNASSNVAVNVPMNDAAVFKLFLGNTSQSEETKVYTLEANQEENPDGAIIRFNGQLSLSVAVPFGQSVEVTMTVERGPVAFAYQDLVVDFFSDCEIERSDALGIDPDATFLKSLVFDVFFLEPCSEVDVTSPLQGWVLIPAMGNILNITTALYDASDPDLELIRLQYRRTQGDGAWINIADIAAANLGPIFTIVPWNTNGLQDGMYDIRAITQCYSGALNPGISHTIQGRIERTPPEIFGTPQPADGVLAAGDEISIQFTEPIRCDLLIQADLFNNNNVGLYDTETGDLVDAIITCQGDKIIIVPNVPNRFIENKVLRVEVDNIKDLASNLFVHKSWEFVVDRNPVHWDGGKVKVAKQKADLVTVTRRIVNDGGQSTAYLIEGVPSWVRVYPLGGLLLPGASEEITFEFGDQLAYGKFLDTISINPPEGRETLVVDCRVLCNSPEWGFDAPAYSQTMNFAVKLNIEGTLSKDEEDIVAAFIDGEVRGTAKVQLLPTLPPLGTQYMAFLTVYGNDDDFNKPVHLEIWDASECLRFGQVTESFNFEADNVIGSVGSPQVIHTNSLVRRDIPINNGWNWLSFNLKFPNPSLNQALGSLLYPENDLIKSQSGFAEYFGSNWLGSLTQLNNTGMFQYRANTPDTIQMIGTLIDPDSLSIPISSGWNWIGYVPNYPLPISQALAGLTALNGDLIKGQTAFAQYLAGFGWLGSLQYLEAPKGYQLKISYPGTLTYPSQNLVGQAVDARGLPKEVLNHWNINPGAFEYSMTLVGMLQANGQNATLEQYELGVFAGNELRGSATAIYIEPLNVYLFFLTTFSNTPGESLHFKLFNSVSGQESNLVEHMYFSDTNHQGSIESPVPFTLESSGLIELSSLRNFEVQPNPFTNSLNIRFQSAVAQEVHMVITDATGRTVYQQKTDAVIGLNTLHWNAEPGSAGLYFVRLEGSAGTVARKIVRQ
jgi:hypothetical protein